MSLASDQQTIQDLRSQLEAAQVVSSNNERVKALQGQLDDVTNKLDAANNDIAQLKTDLATASQRTGNAADPNALLAIAILQHRV